MRAAGGGGRRGFTLVEALSTLVVFSFFLGVLFLTIGWGFRSFSLAVSKSDVTTEARRLALFMERELRSSTYFSITVAQRTVRRKRRDALCFVSRNDWGAPGAYDEQEGAPAWNRYFVYYATTEEPFGQFIRLSVEPTSSALIGSFPYARFSATGTRGQYLLNDPTAYVESDVESARSLASSVEIFEAKQLAGTQELEVRLLLRQNGVMARRANGDREGGTFELQYRVQPQNTL